MAGLSIVVRSAWQAWALVIVVIAAIVVCGSTGRSVTPNYRDAWLRWSEGLPIYQEGPAWVHPLFQ
ncbi:MAG: hypothetical protein ACREJM_12360 [Candidatus Saccharimonadales bacterium]